MALHLYKTLVRQHFEYYMQACRLYLKKDMEQIEEIQRRATKLVPSMRKHSYEGKLKSFNLTTLDMRRITGDLIGVFIILMGHNNVNAQTFFELSKLCTRGHSVKLFKTRCKLDCRKYTFAHGIVDISNSRA
jgi:ribonucleases P/MRP protein subunit RPP40